MVPPPSWWGIRQQGDSYLAVYSYENGTSLILEQSYEQYLVEISPAAATRI